MTKIIVWLAALRAPFLTATIVPFLLGGAITHHLQGKIDIALFILTGIGLICLHLGTNVANDYFDHKHNADQYNKSPTAFSGGSRVIQEGTLSAPTLLVTFSSFFVIGLAIGVYLFLVTRSIAILGIAVFGALNGYYYTAGPLKLAYRGLGELSIGINLGPLISVGTYLVQTQSLSWYVFFSSLPVGLLMVAMIIINEFPDYEADRQAGKNTMVVRIGRKRAAGVYQAIVAGVMLYTIGGICFGLYPRTAWIVFLAAPLAVHAIIVLRAHYDEIDRLIPAIRSNILFHLFFGILLTVGFALPH